MPEWLKKMGANASNYPHSCSPRVGGNSQAQQTFIGNSFQLSCCLHKWLVGLHMHWIWFACSNVMQSFYFLGYQFESIQAQSCMKFGTVQYLFGLRMQWVDLLFASKQMPGYLNKIKWSFLLIKPCMLVFQVQEQLLSVNIYHFLLLFLRFSVKPLEHIKLDHQYSLYYWLVSNMSELLPYC